MVTVLEVAGDGPRQWHLRPCTLRQKLHSLPGWPRAGEFGSTVTTITDLVLSLLPEATVRTVIHDNSLSSHT